MKKEYNLSSTGIKHPLELLGILKELRIVENAPVVFLFDENHDNENDCISKNIENAKTLIKSSNVVLIGVESMAGGKEWDTEIEDYRTVNSDIENYGRYAISWTNNCKKFCDELKINHGNLIIGVESIGMMDKTETDCYDKNPQDKKAFIKNHRVTKLRSMHFIQTLVSYYSTNSLFGNLILNCGSDHNTHIEEWIKKGEIDEIVGLKATYIRINNF